MVRLLNYVNYIKSDAMKIIESNLGWRNYGGKHHESIFTKFFQSHILPVKFNIDKRKAHLSTLICSGQITREQALIELNKDLYSADSLKSDRDYVIKKLGLSESEFQSIMDSPPDRKSTRLNSSHT